MVCPSKQMFTPAFYHADANEKALSGCWGLSF